MGLKIDNNEMHKFNDDITNYFNIEIEEQNRENDYEDLKNNIYSLDIDYEEKANIINAISKLNISKSSKEKRELKSKIEEFKKLHNL